MYKNFRIFLAILATYRLASLITSEEGPFSIFDKLRSMAGAYDYGPNGEATTNLGRGITCPLCVGIYISAAVMWAVILPTRFTDALLIWLGVSGGQVFLENLTSDDAIQSAIEDVAESMEEV